MPDLTSKQRSFLRGLAHDIKQAEHIGKEGVTTAAIRSIRQAFAHRELLKVRVLENAPEETRDAAHKLAAEIDDCVVVQVVGRSATLYRPDPKEPEIKLPR